MQRVTIGVNIGLVVKAMYDDVIFMVPLEIDEPNDSKTVICTFEYSAPAREGNTFLHISIKKHFQKTKYGL